MKLKLNPEQIRSVSEIIQTNIPKNGRKRFISLAFSVLDDLYDELIEIINESDDEFIRQLIRKINNYDAPSANEHPTILLLDVLSTYYANIQSQNSTINNIRREILEKNEAKSPILRLDIIIGVIGIVIAILTLLFGDNLYQRFFPIQPQSTATQVRELTLTTQAMTREATNTPASVLSSTTPRPTIPSSTPRPTDIPATNTPIPVPTDIPPTANNQVIDDSANDYVTNNADWTEQIITFNGVEMVFVPPGCFQMGSADAEGRNEQPVSNLCFDTGFWIDRYEVSNEQFERLNGSALNPSSRSEGNYPRNNVSWREASLYCEMRGGRLPTEAEWEYAASGPDNLRYPWGEEFIEDNLVFVRNSNNTIAPVASTGVSSWVGAYDMAGNVAEWTLTVFGVEAVGSVNLDFTDANEILYDYPYNPNDGRNDVPSDSADLQTYIVVRGGTYAWAASEARTSSRIQSLPYIANSVQGMRCIQTVE
ncbi:MAG: hypothetical protein Phog2KO_40160 [Phototrophicaceae bacterium]